MLKISENLYGINFIGFYFSNKRKSIHAQSKNNRKTILKKL